MQSNFYYQEERQYGGVRLTILFILTFFSIILFEQVDIQMAEKMFFVKVVLVGMLLISMFHYLFILRKPHTLIISRKVMLILLDLSVLTFFISIFEQNGLFLLPLYIVIVMQNGLSFGIAYFYASIALASVSWVLLLLYSPYWREENEIIATFAMTTFLIPLFYLKFIGKVHEKNDELSEILSTTKHDANHDILTGLPNRKRYKEEINKIIKSKEFFALLFIDLNKFKAINDTYGHDVGDSVLQEVSKRLLSIMGKKDFLVRLGGDEFVIITRRKKIFLDKFIEKLEQTAIGDHAIHDVTVFIELSMGISLYPDDIKGSTLQNGGVEATLVRFADEAMYIAKKKPNTYHMLYSNIKS